MAGLIAQQGASVLCAHGGQAQPTSDNPRVRVGGAPTVLLGTPWVVTRCGLPPSAGGPCAGASWLSGTTRVTSSGQPLVVQGGGSLATPTGTPLTVVSVQPRVVAS